MLQRFIDKTVFVEPKNKEVDHSGNPISPEDKELIRLIGLGHVEHMDYDSVILKSLKCGHDFDWNKPAKVRLSVYAKLWNGGPPTILYY